LSALVVSDHALARRDALAPLPQHVQNEDLVLDKWFALQTGAPIAAAMCCPPCVSESTLDFHLKNPNRARSSASANRAPSTTRRRGGLFVLGERVIELDAFNPQVAARLSPAPLDRWKKLARQPYRSAAQKCALPAWPQNRPEQRRAQKSSRGMQHDRTDSVFRSG
jgi:aminopeptidase N